MYNFPYIVLLPGTDSCYHRNNITFLVHVCEFFTHITMGRSSHEMHPESTIKRENLNMYIFKLRLRYQGRSKGYYKPNC